jgi:chemotaxis methyl-accepting protein methylase
LIDKKLQGKNHEQPSLAIWSAGCATGEEPYSIAMSLLDIMDSKGFLNTQILGTDIDEKALIQTRRGIYRQNSLRNIDDNYTDRYFRKVGNQFKPSEKIKNMVNFEHHNLMHLPYPQSI